MNKIFSRFWNWYERNYRLNLGIALFLFVWQLAHLYWLSAHVIAQKLFGQSYFELTPFWNWVIIVVDYTEVPALITTSLVYIYSLKKAFNFKSIFMLMLVNSQWLHLFWITDEFVLAVFTGKVVNFPVWLVWLAILLDYLEIPVIIDTARNFAISLIEG